MVRRKFIAVQINADRLLPNPSRSTPHNNFLCFISHSSTILLTPLLSPILLHCFVYLSLCVLRLCKSLPPLPSFVNLSVTFFQLLCPLTFSHYPLSPLVLVSYLISSVLYPVRCRQSTPPRHCSWALKRNISFIGLPLVRLGPTRNVNRISQNKFRHNKNERELTLVASRISLAN